MKILFIHCAYQSKSGEDAVVQEEIALLRAAGIDVDLLLFDNRHQTLLKLLQMPFNIGAYRQVLKRIALFGPDVVHVHNLHFAASPSVIYAVKQRHLPLVVTLHNYRLLCPSAILFFKGKIFLDSLHQQFPWKAVKEGVFRNSQLLTAWMALSMQMHRWLGTWHLPDRYLVLSKHAEEILISSALGLLKSQLVIKPNCCSAPPLSSERRVNSFLFAGRLCEDKGLLVLLQAFAGCNHKLVIAGDGPLKSDVVTFAKKYPNIVYAGPLSKEDLLFQMRLATALLFPSIWFEGMPLTILEAFASGLPVIASNLGVMKHLITSKHNGLLFSTGNAMALREVVGYWSALPEYEKAIYRTNARSTYEQYYTPEKNAQLLIELYQSVHTKPAVVPVAVAS